MLSSQALHQLDTVGCSAVKNNLLVTVGLVGSLRAACRTNLTLPILIRRIGIQSMMAVIIVTGPYGS